MKIAKLSRIIASVLMGGLGMAAATLATFVQAQNYPGRPITLILPLGAGTGSDVAFRILAEKMSTAFGQQMVVENAPGAAGIIGAQRVARAAPDGYSLGGFNNAIMAILPNILPSAGYDPFKSFEPISIGGGDSDRIAGASEPAGVLGKESDRDRQGASTRAELRHRRRRQPATHCIGNVCFDGRHPVGSCSLQERSPGHA